MKFDMTKCFFFSLNVLYERKEKTNLPFDFIGLKFVVFVFIQSESMLLCISCLSLADSFLI